MSSHIKLSGSWVDVDSVYARVGGSWVEIAEGYTKVAGAWKQFYNSAPAGPSSEIYGITDTHAFVSHNSTSVSTTVTLDSNTNREIWLGLTYIDADVTTALPTVTIAGYAMTLMNYVRSAVGDTVIAYYKYADAGSLGTSATIATTFAWTGTHANYIVWTATPSDSICFDNYSASSNGGVPTTGSLNTSSQGWTFVISTAQNSTAPTSVPNFANGTWYDYGTDEWIAYGYNSPEDDGTVSIVWPDFGSDTEDNIMSAISVRNTVDPLPSYDLLETIELSSLASSITFSGLDSYSGYKHLQIRYTARGTASTAYTACYMQINGATTTYLSRYLAGAGTTPTTGNWTISNGARIFDVAAASNAANTFSAGVIDITDAFSSSKNTKWKNLHGYSGSSYDIKLAGGMWTSVTPVNSITIFSASNWVVGSRFSIYGVRG